MKSYQFSAYGESLALVKCTNPEPSGTEILLRVTACGVCHSDVHLWHGFFEMGGDRRLDVRSVRSLPFTLGHEIAGEVVAVGPHADAEVGDMRVVFPWIGCGDCDVCAGDNEHLCMNPRALGTHLDGGFADHVLVPHSRYLFEYGNVPPAVACTYACSGLTAYSALLKVRDRVDSQLVLIGAGGVGFAGLQIAKAMMDADLIVVEIDPIKMSAAAEAGAAHVIDARNKDAGRELKKLTGGGCAAVIDFVGSEVSASFGFRSVAKSGVLVMVGLFGGSLNIPLPLLVLKDLTIQGSSGSGSLAEMSELMRMVRVGCVDPIPLDPRPLAAADESLRDLEEGRVLGRIVLTP